MIGSVAGPFAEGVTRPAPVPERTRRAEPYRENPATGDCDCAMCRSMREDPPQVFTPTMSDYVNEQLSARYATLLTQQILTGTTTTGFTWVTGV